MRDRAQKPWEGRQDAEAERQCADDDGNGGSDDRDAKGAEASGQEKEQRDRPEKELRDDRGRVAYDARVELLSAREIRQMLTFNARAAGWRAVVARYDVLALDPRSPAPLPDLRGWRVVYRSSNVVLVRRAGTRD